MNDRETHSYRVKFSNRSGSHSLVGIVDRPHSPLGSLIPTVVFSHCFTCNKDLKAIVRISRALARSGINVLRFDMTGLGGSEGHFSESNFSTNLADLAAAIRFAHAELGPVTTLLGHSFGGVASLVTAARSGAAPTSVATVGSETLGSAINVDSITETPPLANLKSVATLASPSDTGHLANLLTRMNPEIETVGQGIVTIGGMRWNIHKQMLDDFRRHDVTAELPKITCPVLLMHSPVDETVGIDHAIRLMMLIQSNPNSGSNAITPVSLVSLPGADHLLANDPRDLVFASQLLAAWCHRF